MSTCAACGKGGDDLKVCEACEQVKYCNGACKKAHWKKHKKQCRKSAAKNRDDARIIIDALSEEMNRMVISDDELFKDPPPKEECPICLLPVPYAIGACGVQTAYQPCCGKILCHGCMFAATEEIMKGNMKRCCPFCRKPLADSDEEHFDRCKKRMEASDAEAFVMVGNQYQKGSYGLPQDKRNALKLYLQAAKLGSYEAHFQIANAYRHGEDYVEKDMKRAAHHYKLAAMGGDEIARYNFAIIEECECMNRAMRHFLILARIGCDDS